MDSLPFEFCWEGKTEPLSPSQVEFYSFDEFPFEDDFAKDFILDDAILFNNKISAIDKLQEIILLNEAEEIDDIDDDIKHVCKNDQWLGDQTVIPFEPQYPTDPIGLYPVKTTNTNDLLMDFDSVYDSVEYTHLTPPQTPPEIKRASFIEQNKVSPQFTNIDDIPIHFHQQNQQQQQQQHQQNLHPVLFDDNDLARELELVEELIRSRQSKDLHDFTTYNEDSFGSGESVSSSSSASSSSFCLSPARSDISKNSHEDEWYPETTKIVKRTKKSHTRTTEDRKSRKKEQNKNAATRYRQKKKTEIEEILIEEQGLRVTNRKLQTNYNDIKREIKYLKGLLRELYDVKGGLKN